MLSVKKVSALEYDAFLEKEKLRYFINQSSSFGEQKRAEHVPVEYLLFYQEGTAVASALVVYYQYKKFFKTAQVLYGPTVPARHLSLLKELLLSLKKHVFSSFFVRNLKINPLFPKYLYKDIQRGEACSKAEEEVLESLGFERIQREWYEDASVPLRCVYTKTIENLSYEEVFESLDLGLKQSIKKALDAQVKVRMLSREELSIFNEMLQETLESKDTIVRARPEQSVAFYDAFREKIHFPLAYLDVPQTILLYEEQEKNLEQKYQELNDKYENKQQKKYLNLLKDLDDQKARLHKLKKQLQLFPQKMLPLASSCFIESGKDFIHFLAGAPKAYMQYQGMAAIHQVMLKMACEKGFSYYNLYGCSDKLDENDSNFGVLKFKRNFKGHFEEFIGTYLLKRPWFK